MNEHKDPFNTPIEEAERLALEIRTIKETLREILRRVTQIENRARRSFPREFANDKRSAAISVPPSSMCSKTEEELRRVYQECIDLSRGGDLEPAAAKLSALSTMDIAQLRTILGAPLGKKKPTRKNLVDVVLARINESVLISQHQNRRELVDSEENAEMHSLPSRKSVGDPTVPIDADDPKPAI